MKPAGVERPGQRGTHSRARCLPTIPAPARPEQPPRTPPLARHAGGMKDRRKRRQPRRPERIVGGAAAPRPVLVPRGTLGGRDQVRNAPSLILRRALPRGGGPCCIGKACGTGRRLGSPRLDAGEQAERDEGDAPAADAGCARHASTPLSFGTGYDPYGRLDAQHRTFRLCTGRGGSLRLASGAVEPGAKQRWGVVASTGEAGSRAAHRSAPVFRLPGINVRNHQQQIHTPDRSIRIHAPSATAATPRSMLLTATRPIDQPAGKPILVRA